MAFCIGDEHVEHWRAHGYAIVESFLDDDELKQARADLYDLFPTAEQFTADPSKYPAITDPANGVGQAFAEFPMRAPFLNRVSTHPEFISFVARCLGTDDLLMTQSHVWAKYGAGGATHDQALHFDYNDNSLVVPSEDLTMEQIPFIVYYEDVTADLGPTYVLSKQHTAGMDFVDKSNDNPYFWSHRPRDAYPELYERETPVTVPAGSVMFFTMSTLHRGSMFDCVEGSRFSHHMVYRSAACNWMGWTDWPRSAISKHLVRFVEEASVAERTLIGFPPPGHHYWTAATRAGVAARYPNMDMTPYA